MNLKQQIDAQIKDAMKARDQLRLDTVRAIKSAIKYKEVEGGESKELDDAAIVRVIQTQVKQRRDASEQYRAGGRPELADKEEREIEVLQTFLPQPLSADELRQLVADCVREAGATSPKDMGAVMKLVQPKIQGRAEGKAVSEEVKRQLSGA